MDIVLLAGGLGNQLSQYAFAIAKRQKNQVKVNTYLERRHREHQGYELQNIFGIRDESDGKTDLICRFFRKIHYLKINKESFWNPFCGFIFALLERVNIHLVLEAPDYTFDSSLLERKSGLNLYMGGVAFREVLLFGGRRNPHCIQVRYWQIE